MEEVKEEIKVTIEETPKESPKVKDFSFGINTVNSGMATFITEPINGILEGIFVNSLEPIQLRILIGDSDINMFEMQSFQGKQFIPVRLGVVDSLGASFQNAKTKWALNDVLRFEVKGPLNAEVGFTVRYC